MTAVDVTYVFDGGYLRPSLISAYSVLKHRPADLTLRFLVTEAIPALVPAADHLRAAFPKARIEVQPIDFDSSLAVQGHVSAAALARLNLPALLDQPTLYLDGDTMVRRDIGPLFAPRPNGAPLAAVRDPGILKALHQRAGRGWLPRANRRGICAIWTSWPIWSIRPLISTAAWCCSICRASGRWGCIGAWVIWRRRSICASGLRFNDQNWLNVVFKGQIDLLDPTWNTLWGNRLTGRSPFPQADRAAFSASRRDPAIVHFTGRLRPWEIRHPWLYPKRHPGSAPTRRCRPRPRRSCNFDSKKAGVQHTPAFV
ncbi:glycosyltransferase family 8 protein [Gemmobacter lanyuensis]